MVRLHFSKSVCDSGATGDSGAPINDLLQLIVLRLATLLRLIARLGRIRMGTYSVSSSSSSIALHSSASGSSVMLLRVSRRAFRGTSMVGARRLQLIAGLQLVHVEAALGLLERETLHVHGRLRAVDAAGLGAAYFLN